jgi:hypothetical protein
LWDVLAAIETSMCMQGNAALRACGDTIFVLNSLNRLRHNGALADQI